MATGPLKAGMKVANALIAVNARPCNAAGHTIRTNGGHCAQCDTQKIAFSRRHSEPANVYIAVSNIGRLLKVGLTIDLRQRESQLIGYAYGRQKDWKIVRFRHSNEAGKDESLAHKILAKFSIHGTYYKDGNWMDCYELFSCGEQQCLEALQVVTDWTWSTL